MRQNATPNAIAKAAPLKNNATVVTARREDLFPKKPLIAAPASGRTGINQRLRFGFIA
jgi:hypothetical protein